jgi:hypothetical protein
MNIYTTLQPNELWLVFKKGVIYKGGGNNTEAKMVRQNRLRAADFDIRYNTAKGINEVHPNPSKGLSFSGTIDRLARLDIEGQVWQFDNTKQLPRGLVVNFNDMDHPLVNVDRVMLETEVIDLLCRLGKLMARTPYRIKSGVIVK